MEEKCLTSYNCKIILLIMDVKTCKNCKRFKCFYTKNKLCFHKHFLGICTRHKVISEEQNTCIFWENCKNKQKNSVSVSEDKSNVLVCHSERSEESHM